MHPRIFAWPALLCALLSVSVNAADKPAPLELPAIIITAPAPDTVVDSTDEAGASLTDTASADVQR